MASCSRIFLFILTLGLELADLVLDWDFYYEVHKTDVVGNNIKWSILAFAILGTILFLSTLVTKFCGICNSDDDDQEEENGTCAVTLSWMTLLFEDLPQIILALIVAFQTKDLLAPVQIAKAGYGILEPIIQITIHSYRYWKLRNHYYYENETQMRCKIFEIIGSVILIILSIILLVDLVTDH